MAFRLPLQLRPSLAVCSVAASVLASFAQPAAAASVDRIVLEAASDYLSGRALTAQRKLETALEQSDVKSDPAARRMALETLLDICIRINAADCVIRQAPIYVQAMPTFSSGANAVQKAEIARQAVFYFDYARYLTFDPAHRRAAIADFPKLPDNAFNTPLYLRRLALKANLRLADGDLAGARGEADRMLSLIASLQNPQEDSFGVAVALTDAISILVATGETERAYGVYRASGAFIFRSLGPKTADHIAFRLTEARLLEAMGMAKAAIDSLDAVEAGLLGIEAGPTARTEVLAEVRSTKAVACVVAGDLACAERAVADHPLAIRFPAAATPQSPAEAAYLAARALTAAAAGRSDAVAAASLARPLDFGFDGRTQAAIEVWRRAGAALGAADHDARQQGLTEAGEAVIRAAGFPGAGFGAWRRPGFVDQAVIALALDGAGNAGRSADATAFALHQLAARQGGAFDADAMTALAQARDETARRTTHQALRLRARRDRLEREALASLGERAAQPRIGGPLKYDFSRRRVFRDFAVRIDEAGRQTAAAGVTASGANLIALDRFQAVLRPNEAALSVASTPGGGLAYICVRKDRVLRTSGPVDLGKLRLDVKLLQAALTAGHAPSEALDSQFPVAASTRLYDVLVRPFEACLKPGDAILWLRGLGTVPVPLAALLASAPPKAGKGYDLGAADWLVRRYAVAYAGSASAVAAARSRPRRTADFDFLGVGDPQLTGALAALPPLPETRPELEDSAKGFGRARLLLGGGATERALRGQMVGNYRYLSFATHGLLRDEIEGLPDPALALTPVAADDPANDGLLTASEIADLNLSAGFVALSACNTANVDVTRMSSDLPALASAFAVAGAPATLATLWPVDSQTSQKVVTSTFQGLGDDRAPAEALAQAQRAFLAAPPGKAWLHPRFWAPFVVLGDGGAAQSAAALKPVSVEVLTTRGGEVLSLKRTDRGVAARLISDRDASGVHTAGLKLPGWRQDTVGVGAARPVIDLGSQLAAGGYSTKREAVQPVLEFFDKASGAPRSQWVGEVQDGLFGYVAAGTATGPDAWVFAVGQRLTQKSAPGAQPVLQLYTLDSRGEPQRLAVIETPRDTPIDTVVLTPMGDAVLVAYGVSGRFTGRAPPPGLDDFDLPLCGLEAVTWLELRDLRTGARLAAREVMGWSVSAAIAEGGSVVIGGARRGDCQEEAKAAIGRVGPDMQIQNLYIDTALGESGISALSPLADGRILAAGMKRNLYDAAPSPSVEGAAYGLKELPISMSGMVFTLRKDGKASPPRMLDSGSYVLVSAAEASEAKDILIGGSIGEQAAIFHLPSAP